MRKLLILCGLLALTGCRNNLVGPFQPRSPERVDDPRLTIDEQAVRARDRLGYPEENRPSGPRAADPRPPESPFGPLP